jgi:TatD DNase family protein
MFIDTHCHLDDPLLCDRLSEVLAAAEKCGVSRFIVPGVEPSGWERILSLAEKDERIYAAPGAHPLKADKWNLAAAVMLRKLAPDISAIGEIGLDYSGGMPPRELQQEVFRAQLTIAREAHLPVIIHCRRAFADTLSILAEVRIKDFGGVMHAFSGSVEVARNCVSLGLKIGIAGPVTWGNAIRPLQVVTDISLEHLLLETDSPDLSPEPHKGAVNEPAFLLHIAHKIAELKGVLVAEVVEITSGTAQALFRLKR